VVTLQDGDGFITEFVHFILGDETGPETQDTQSGHRLRRRLIERCDHISDEACASMCDFACFQVCPKTKLWPS